MNMLIGMLKAMIPDAGDYRIQYGTHEDENGKVISVQLGDGKTGKLVAVIDITIPK